MIAKLLILSLLAHELGPDAVTSEVKFQLDAQPLTDPPASHGAKLLVPDFDGGVCYTTKQVVRIASHVAAEEAAHASLAQSLDSIPWKLYFGLGSALGLILGFGIGFGISQLVHR